MTTEQHDQNLQDVLAMIDDIAKKTQPAPEAKPAQPAPEAKPAQPAPAIKVAEVVEVAPEAKPEAIPNPFMGNGEEVEEAAEKAAEDDGLQELLDELDNGGFEENFDWRARRLEITQQLKDNYGLNEEYPVPVGSATVDALGVTVWQDSLPEYYFMEPVEDSLTFGKRLSQRGVDINKCRYDVIRCIYPTNTLIKSLAYRGEIEVSRVYRNNYTMTTPKLNDCIKIGALLTKGGNVRFIAMGLVGDSIQRQQQGR